TGIEPTVREVPSEQLPEAVRRSAAELAAAAEDRNTAEEMDKTVAEPVAPALQGWRGSQLRGQDLNHERQQQVAPALRGRRGSQHRP
ncbi:hypothetical protein, partial [Saccharopolyspora sp. NPDC002686]|uniref:hypothetical protein n=1 Tax=Saccharopolyspora sp. NPDC002686 TaxID=3154541 RepID=UPI003323A140